MIDIKSDDLQPMQCFTDLYLQVDMHVAFLLSLLQFNFLMLIITFKYRALQLKRIEFDSTWGYK